MFLVFLFSHLLSHPPPLGVRASTDWARRGLSLWLMVCDAYVVLFVVFCEVRFWSVLSVLVASSEPRQSKRDPQLPPPSVPVVVCFGRANLFWLALPPSGFPEGPVLCISLWDFPVLVSSLLQLSFLLLHVLLGTYHDQLKVL